MAITVNVQLNRELFPDIILLTLLCFYHWGTRLSLRREKFLKKHLNASKPSEHPSSSSRKKNENI